MFIVVAFVLCVYYFGVRKASLSLSARGSILLRTLIIYDMDVFGRRDQWNIKHSRIALSLTCRWRISFDYILWKAFISSTRFEGVVHSIVYTAIVDRWFWNDHDLSCGQRKFNQKMYHSGITVKMNQRAEKRRVVTKWMQQKELQLENWKLCECERTTFPNRKITRWKHTQMNEWGKSAPSITYTSDVDWRALFGALKQSMDSVLASDSHIKSHADSRISGFIYAHL